MSSRIDARGSNPNTIYPSLKSITDSMKGGVGFMQRLEKHLSDTKDGVPMLSREVAAALGKKQRAAGALLGMTDPDSLSLYSAYLTSFTRYDKKARFVATSSEALAHIEKIKGSIEA